MRAITVQEIIGMRTMIKSRDGRIMKLKTRIWCVIEIDDGPRDVGENRIRVNDG
jgi:hypothetical protein